jgi:biotin operon repressor
MGTFLSEDEVAELTGRKVKAKQIDQLKKMGVPFYVNASGRAVVVRSVLDGSMAKAEPEKRGWMPRVVPA